MAFPARARFLVPLAIAVALGAWFLRAPAGGPPPAAPVVMDEAGPDAEEPDAEDPGTAGGEGTQEVAPSGDLEVPVAVAVAASPIAPPEPPTSPPAPAEREAPRVSFG